MEAFMGAPHEFGIHSLSLWLVSRKDRQEGPVLLHRYIKNTNMQYSAMHCMKVWVLGWLQDEAELVSCAVAKDHGIPKFSCEDCFSRPHSPHCTRFLPLEKSMEKAPDSGT